MILRSVRTLRRFAVALAVSATLLPAAHAYTTESGGRYGDVSVTRPAGPVRGFVVLFSRITGWSAQDQNVADSLAKAGALTVGVDTAVYASNLSKVKESCHELVGDAEALSHQLERQTQSNRYYAPIMVGTAEGAALAKAVLAQAPSNTIAGAVLADAVNDPDPRFRACPPDPTVSRGKGLPGFLEIAKDRAGDSNPLLPAVSAHLGRPVSTAEADVSDLPLVELPATKPNGLLAIVMSGDGGWRDLDKTIAEHLQKDGVSVVGWDSLRYFWSEKSPAQTSHDLGRVIAAYSARWHTTRVALIGYSFGADVMPFAYNRLPPELREQVSLISLLGFAPDADFQIRVTGWLGMPASDKAMKVQPELSKVPPAIVQCFYGEHEEDTLCPKLAKSGIEVIRTPGDHHFGGDYAALEGRILQSFKKQSGAQ